MSLPNTEILTHITQQYCNATTSWYSTLFPIASHLFAMLAIIELAWSGIWWAIEKSQITSLWTELLKKVMVIGFFYTIMFNAQNWIPSIIRSFMFAGASAAHISHLDPSSLLDQGISLASSVFVPLEKTGLLGAMNVGGWFIGTVVAIFILLSFVVIAGLLVVTLVESYIVVGAGILMLGFSASRWTTQYAAGYLSYAVSVGTKLFILYLVVGVGSNLAVTWGNLIATGGLTNLTPFFEVLGSSLIFASIAMTIPSKASSIVSGATHASFSTLAAATGTAIYAAKMPAKVLFGGASALKETLAQGQTITQQQRQSGSSTLVSVLKGTIGAASNLGVATLGSAIGHYHTAASAMKSKSKAIKENQDEGNKNKKLGDASQRSSRINAAPMRPDNPSPPQHRSSKNQDEESMTVQTVMPILQHSEEKSS